MDSKRGQKVSRSSEHDISDEWVGLNQVILDLIHKFSQSGSTQEFLDKVVDLIQRESGCKYVGIRVLDESGYIPYQSYVGFSREFWEEENMIQISQEDCSCTRILSGNLLTCDKAVINDSGSLCINDSNEFMKTLSDTELLAYRGACVRWGYRSVAIVPIIYDNTIVGLFHLADPKPGQIRSTILLFVESIAPLVGEILSKSKIERHLNDVEKQKNILESIVGGVGNLAYVVNLDTCQLLYCQNTIFGPDKAGYKCYELLGSTSPCGGYQAICPGICGDLDCWEHYDSLRDRYYFAEKKNISWFDGEIIRAAFVTDITVHRKTENALKRSITELQNIKASLEAEIKERHTAQKLLRENTEMFRHRAMTDMLTGLPNRSCLTEQLEREMAKARKGEASGSILFIDLDDLKVINDTLGHKHGDTLIISASSLIVAELGGNALVARIGGDEFIVMSSVSNRQELAEIADRVVRALHYDYDVLEMKLRTSASIGIAIYPDDGDSAEEIFKNADSAMYAAKSAGKNCWRFYEQAMQIEAYEEIALTSSLRSAIELGELTVVYQPQVSVKDNSVVGFEALLRWFNHQHGSISPLRFIPLAEKSGLIHSIGQWVMKEACLFAETLNVKGWSNIRIAVNVSPCQLAYEFFGDMVRETLDKVKIRPDQLELEITETALISSLDRTLKVLGDLNDFGVRLALDDFGTGYSSLTYLNCLPVQTLKIDKSFIDKNITNKMQPKMIKSIVAMAHNMKMSVVAEGVETNQQLDLLIKNRCDFIQGYYFSKPLPGDAAIRFLQEHNELSVAEWKYGTMKRGKKNFY